MWRADLQQSKTTGGFIQPFHPSLSAGRLFYIGKFFDKLTSENGRPLSGRCSHVNTWGKINHRPREEQVQKSLQKSELWVHQGFQEDMFLECRRPQDKGVRKSQKRAKSQNVPVCLLGVLFRVRWESVVGLWVRERQNLTSLIFKNTLDSTCPKVNA